VNADTSVTNITSITDITDATPEIIIALIMLQVTAYKEWKKIPAGVVIARKSAIQAIPIHAGQTSIITVDVIPRV